MLRIATRSQTERTGAPAIWWGRPITPHCRRAGNDAPGPAGSRLEPAARESAVRRLPHFALRTFHFALSVALLCAGAAQCAEKPAPVLSLSLEGCPEGAALEFEGVPAAKRRFGPPSPAVDRFFAGWTPGLSGWKDVPGCMKVQKEDDAPTLVCSPTEAMPGRSLVGGQPTWQDYDVEAAVRLVRQTLIPMDQAYGEHTNIPQVGVFARGVDSIRCYLLALEPGQVSLYRKEQEEWIPLARKQMPIRADTFYALRLSVAGESLRGYVDGKLVADATDGAYPSGKAGLRFNAESRVRGIRVTMTPAQKARSEAARKAWEAEEAKGRARFPKPVVLRKVELPGKYLYPARLRAGRPYDLVVVGGGKTSAVDLEGKILWQYPAQLSNVAPGGPDGEGVSRVAGMAGRKLVMLDGRTGQLLHETDAPPQVIYNCWRLGNLAGKGEVNYVSRSGDNTADFTVYDERLGVLFRGKSAIEVGHTYGLGFWDVDADGVEELQAGGSCFRGDGSRVWDSRVTEAHLDQVMLGPLGPFGEPVSVFLGVDEGVTFVDGLSGERIACVPNGHPQGVIAGNFRPDLPGLEVLAISRWASYGVTGLFTGRGEILKQWMLAGEELPSLSLPVTWGAGDLILASLLHRPPTLYDGHGHELFRLPEAPGYRIPMTLLPLDVTGDGQDEILSVNGTTLTIYTQAGGPRPAGERQPSTVKWMNLSVPAWTLSGGDNLLANGGFEDAGADGKPAGWRLAGAAAVVADAAKVFSGKSAARVNFDNSAWAEIPVKPETVYLVTGFARHDVPTAVDPGRLKILFKAEDGTLVGAVAARLFGLNANAYRGFQHAFRTPAGARTCSLGLCGRFTGSDYILYDGVRMREVPAR